MISFNSQAQVSSSSSINAASSPSTNTGSRVFENDKFSFSTHGTQDVSLHNKHSGATHEASGDFGQSELTGCCHDHQGAGNGPIDKIVRKVLEKVCEALGIDPSEIFGEQPQESPSSPGCGSEDFPSLGTDPWGFPYKGEDSMMYAGGSPNFDESTGQYITRDRSAAPADDRPTGPIPDPLGLGSAQNQRDHNGIERALDPLGIF